MNARLGAVLAVLCTAACAAACGANEARSETGPGASQAAGGEVAGATPAGELLPNGVAVEEGLLAGGQPTPEQLVALAGAGYVTVIDLRTEAEGGTGRADVEASGMTYVTLPIAGAAGLTEENARRLALLLEEVERPLVLHCGSGNRVGALLALKVFYADGATPEEALRYGLDAGLTGLEGAVREHLEVASRASRP